MSNPTSQTFDKTVPTQGSEVAPVITGVIVVIWCNAAAVKLLLNVNRTFISDQEKAGVVTRSAAAQEPGSEGSLVFTTYRRDIAEILIAPFKSYDRSAFPGVAHRRMYVNLDPKKQSRRPKWVKGQRRYSRKSKGGSDSFTDTGSSVDFSDTGSFHSSGSVSFSAPKDRMFGVYVSGRGITKEIWMSSPPIHGAKFSWWESVNGKVVNAFINFQNDKLRTDWVVNHPFLKINGQARKVIVQR